MNESNPENIQRSNKLDKRPISTAGETTIDPLNASALDSSLYQVALPNPDEEIDTKHGQNGIVNLENNPSQDEESKEDHGSLPSAFQIELNSRINPHTSKKLAKAYKNNKRYKLYWKIFTVLTSLALSGYLMVEAYALDCVILEKSPDSQSNSTVRYLMNGFLRMENLLFVNLYMNFIVYILGLMIILYSTILLLIERDQPWKWFKDRHKKVARWGYLLFVTLYSLGGLVQTGFVLSHMKDPTIQSGGSYYAFMIMRGVFFYLNLACFRKIERFKFVQTEIFKDVVEKKNLKFDKESKDLDDNWQQLYEAPEEDELEEQGQPASKSKEGGAQPQDATVIISDKTAGAELSHGSSNSSSSRDKAEN